MEDKYAETLPVYAFLWSSAVSRPQGLRCFQSRDSGSSLALTEIVCFLRPSAKLLSVRLVYVGPDYWIQGIKHPDSAMKRLFDTVVNFLKREWFLLVAALAIAIIITVFELL